MQNLRQECENLNSELKKEKDKDIGQSTQIVVSSVGYGKNYFF